MTATLYETIQQIIRQELSRLRTAEIGTVEAQFPHNSSSSQENNTCSVRLRNSGILLKKVPVSTPRLGAASIPAVGDLVLVQFVDGDINAPVIIGCLYNDQDRPPENDSGQVVLNLPLGESPDNSVRLEISSESARIVKLVVGKGITITVQDDDPVATVEVDGGKAKLQLDRDGAVTIESQGKIALKGSEISIEAQSGNLDLKGQTVNIKGQPTVNIN